MPKSRRITRNHRTARPLSHKAYAAVEKAATGLFHWATTDHSGFSQALRDMPTMGFMDSLKYMLWQMLIAFFCSLVSAVLMFLLVAYVVPYLLLGAITW